MPFSMHVHILLLDKEGKGVVMQITVDLGRVRTSKLTLPNFCTPCNFFKVLH